MKKIISFLMIMFVVCNVFARGNIYFSNIGPIHGNKDLIRFKLVIYDRKNHAGKELYTDVIPPEVYETGYSINENPIKIAKEKLDTKDAEIDYYIENVTKNTGFQKCDLTWEYSPIYHTKIGGWHDGQNYACHIMED